MKLRSVIEQSAPGPALLVANVAHEGYCHVVILHVSVEVVQRFRFGFPFTIKVTIRAPPIIIVSDHFLTDNPITFLIKFSKHNISYRWQIFK